MTEDLVERAGQLKRQLVDFSKQTRYDRAFREFVAQHGDGAEAWDEDRAMLLWDTFLLEHRFRNGRSIVEQFVDARPDLSPAERQMLLGWHDVVTGVFEVKGRDGPALVLANLVDDLTYRTRSTAGRSVFRRMPKRSFLLTRLVAVGDEWVFSGPTSVLRPAERDVAVQVALQISVRSPELAFRNAEKLALAWELQRVDRQRFVRFFGSDLVVVPGDRAQQRLDEFSAFRQEEILREDPEKARHIGRSPARVVELPPDLVDAETVALIHDEDDGLGFYEEFGLVEQAFADPDLLRRRAYREQVLAYLHDDSVEPMVLRRLADRDPDKAGVLFRRLLKRPRFDWARDGEELLRSVKAEYFARPRLPTITPVGERLAAYARQR
ncbi:hypothetical protein E4P41_07755 [Geodermatophilus sp. DF01-2]|uniref:hypothetical protein n=1 Tax=Geodermatophilus sp. DF01-2 TaxID=2559610 RepID=UPI001073C7BB|nr:hypothetical protein [Geodermatophilus sp. DF01_2]TFV62256.1 hypothetical protein E4P41_07755 [Geodermatophilus sp. DF01_2]